MLGVGVALMALPAHAETDELIEGAKLCTAYLPRYEREYAIPTHLLSAIATTESGRYHDGLRIRVPWPWTINANGKGYIFDTKAQAIAAVKRLRSRGVQSIDVGCMQVNIYHHPDAFASLDQAFEPEANIAYAAGFLRNLYDEEGSWKKAAADYHSKTPGLGRKYVTEVYNSWYQIIDKLRAAKLQVPESSVAAMNELKASAHKASAKVRSLHDRVTTKLAVYHPPHMNDIHLARQETAGRSDVIIVKPEITVADNTPVEAVVAQYSSQYTPKIVVSPAQQVPLTLGQMPEPSEGQVIRIGDQSAVEPAAVSSRKTGPNFIFND